MYATAQFIFGPERLRLSESESVRPALVESANVDNQSVSSFCCRRCLSGNYVANAGNSSLDSRSGSSVYRLAFNTDGSGSLHLDDYAMGNRKYEATSLCTGQ